MLGGNGSNGNDVESMEPFQEEEEEEGGGGGKGRTSLAVEENGI